MIKEFFANLLTFPKYWEVEKIEHDIDTNEVDIYIKFNTETSKVTMLGVLVAYIPIRIIEDGGIWIYCNIKPL